MPIIKQSSQNNEVDWDDPLNKGLVAWYPMRQKGGNVLRDVAGENHGTLDSSMTSDDWIASPETKSLALDFDGSNDSVLIPNAVVPTIPVTMCAWVRPDSDSGGIVNISTSGSGTGQESTQLNVTADNFPLVQVQDGAAILTAIGPVAMVPGEWHFVAAQISLEGSTKSGSIYLNGIWQASDTTTSAISLRSRASIGAAQRRNGAVTAILRAGISDVRIYDRALSDSEIHDLYQASRTGYQDQFKRRYFPVSTTVEEPPVEETSGGLIRLKNTSQTDEVDWNDPLNKGLLIWYPMRQKGGNVLRDVAGENHGTLESSMTSDDWVPSPETKSLALEFDGSNDFVEIPYKAGDAGYPFSIAAWVQPSGTTSAQAVWSVGGSTDSRNRHILYHRGDQPGDPFQAFTEDQGSFNVTTSDVETVQNSWHFVVAVFDNATEKRIYVNGDGSSTEPNTEACNPFPVDRHRIARRADSQNGLSFLGAVADFRFYDDRALSETEVHDLYQASRTGYQDQFKRRYFPVSTTIEEPPVEETTGGLIRLKSPKPTQPSYKTGYAKSASESANPELWDGLKGAWMPSLGITGLTLRDVSGNARHGTLQNADESSWTMHNGQRSLFLDGVDQWARIDSAVLNGINNISIVARVAGTLPSKVNRAIFAMADDIDVNDQVNHMRLNWSDYTRGYNFDAYPPSGGQVNANGLFDMAQDGTWHQLAFTKETSSGSVYYDGELRASPSGMDTSLGGWTPTGTAIGKSCDTSGNYFQGYIGDVLVYDRALSAEEIALLNADPLAPFRQRRTAIYSTQATAPPAFNHWYTRPGRKHRIVGSGVYV